MKKSEIAVKSFLNAAGVFAYVAAVASILSRGERLFGPEKSMLIPVMMLLLLVVSAAITGLLVLGRPIHWYFGGMKREAFALLFATLGWLFLFLLAVAFSLFFLAR